METVMADPVGVFARGIHLYAVSALICIWGVGSIKQPYSACHPGCLNWECCASLCVSWYTLEGMETFANRAAAVLLFLACSGQ